MIIPHQLILGIITQKEVPEFGKALKGLL